MRTDHVASPGWTSPRSAVRSRRTAKASRRTVLIAVAAKAVVTLTKLIAGILSGSAAILAETAHSLADTVNQAFLLFSISLAEREPTPDQPFGYGRVRFLWTFVAAIAMFLAGAIFAVGYGTYQLIAGETSSDFVPAYIALGVSLVAEGTSWVRAVRQTRGDAADAKLPLLRFVRESRDPNVKMVLFEDTAALAGLALALIGIITDQLTGNSVFDPAASIAIGALLVIVAAWMGHDTSELLVGGAALPAERTELRRALEESGDIKDVFELLTMVLGPSSLLVAARVDFDDDLDDEGVERASDAIECRLREAVPDVTEVFLDATSARTERRAEHVD